jgi:putative oxygen-independent coproporphyrinogen III oxidase
LGRDAQPLWPAGTGFGIYLHWPFCAAKCPYCDFNSHVAAAIDMARWRAAFLTEIDRLADAMPGRTVDTVFLGGGTPSLMPADLVGDLIDRIAARWTVADAVEITLEANPGSVEAGRLAGYRAAGVNRLSLGVQALDDAALRALGRTHTAAEAWAAVALGHRLFDRVSFDLIHARQHQTVADWRAELRSALAIAGEHLSLYQLTIEPGTAFARRAAAGGLAGLPDEDRGAEMFEATEEICAAAGWPAYEISNHARPGAACRHNLLCWQGGAYAGIGPGAHGRIVVDGQRVASAAARQPGLWLQRVETGEGGDAARAPVSGGEAAIEYALGALRTVDGIDRAHLDRLDSGALDCDAVAQLGALGFLEATPGRLRLTRTGRLLLDSILAAILTVPQPLASGRPSDNSATRRSS